MTSTSSGFALPALSRARAPSSSGVSDTHSTSSLPASRASNALGCFVPFLRMCGETIRINLFTLTFLSLGYA